MNLTIGNVGILFLVVSANAAPWLKNLEPMKRIVKNLIKKLPEQLDEAELVDPPHVRFTSVPKDVVISEGQAVTLTCEAEGIPPPTIKWTHNDKVIKVGDYSDNIVEKLMNVGKTTIQRGITVSKISVDCASLESAGIYKCIANNGHETVEAAAEVTVNEGNSVGGCSVSKKAGDSGRLPQIYMWTDGRFEVSGANAQLYCRATGEPKPKIEWLKSDGAVIESSNAGPFDILPNGDLIIRDADFDSLDVYTCVARNVHGEDSAEAFFYPTEPEDSDENVG